MKRVQEQYGKDGFVVVGFDSDDTVEKMNDYIAEKGYGWSQWFMGKQTEAQQDRYWVEGYPTNFLVGRDGKIVSRRVRFGHGAKGEAMLREALAKPSPDQGQGRK